MLRVSELSKDKSEKTKRNRALYKSLLQDCYKRIKNANSSGATHTTYTLRPISLGMPLYNVHHAIMYITNRLKKGGFDVYALHTNSVFVTWKI